MKASRSYTTFSNQQKKFVTLAYSTVLKDSIHDIQRRGIYETVPDNSEIFAKSGCPSKFVCFSLNNLRYFLHSIFLGDKNTNDYRGGNYFIDALVFEASQAPNPVFLFQDKSLWKTNLKESEDIEFTQNPLLEDTEIPVTINKLDYLKSIDTVPEETRIKLLMLMELFFKCDGKRILINSKYEDYSTLVFLLLDILPDCISKNISFSLNSARPEKEDAALVEAIEFSRDRIRNFKINYSILDFVNDEVPDFEIEDSYLAFVDKSLKSKTYDLLTSFNYFYALSISDSADLPIITDIYTGKSGIPVIVDILEKKATSNTGAKAQIIKFFFDGGEVKISEIIKEEVRRLDRKSNHDSYGSLKDILNFYNDLNVKYLNTRLLDIVLEFGSLNPQEKVDFTSTFVSFEQYDTHTAEYFAKPVMEHLLDQLYDHTIKPEHVDMLRSLWKKFINLFGKKDELSKLKKKFETILDIRQAKDNRESVELLRQLMKDAKLADVEIKNDLFKILKYVVKKPWKENNWKELITLLRQEKMNVNEILIEFIGCIYWDRNFYPKADYLVRELIKYLVESKNREMLDIIYKGLNGPLKESIQEELKNLLNEGWEIGNQIFVE